MPNMSLYPSYIAYTIILIGSSIIACLLLIRIWVLRSTPGAYGMMISVASVAEWSLAYVMEIIQTDMAEKIFWAKMEFLGISFVAVGIFIFAMYYSGRGASLTFLRAILLLTPAILGFILALTNELHHQIWTAVRFSNGLPFGPLDVTHGVGFFVLTAFLYSLILLTTISFFQIAIRGQGLYSYQARVMLAGMFFPWAANIIYISGLSPFPSIDLTPLALTFANVAISISFLRYRFNSTAITSKGTALTFSSWCFAAPPRWISPAFPLDSWTLPSGVVIFMCWSVRNTVTRLRICS